MDEIEKCVCYEKYCVIVLVLAIIIIVDMWLLAYAEMLFARVCCCQLSLVKKYMVPPWRTLWLCLLKYRISSPAHTVELFLALNEWLLHKNS